MAFLDLAGSRFSVRKFSNEPVEKEKIIKILEAGQSAPTACNFQPQKIYVFESISALGKLKSCKLSDFNETLAFLVCYDQNLCWKRDYDGKASGEVDASIVATHMMLEAWECGIGSTLVMHFDPKEICDSFSIPANEIPVCLLLMGYPEDGVLPSKLHSTRKTLDDTTICL